MKIKIVSFILIIILIAATFVPVFADESISFLKKDEITCSPFALATLNNFGSIPPIVVVYVNNKGVRFPDIWPYINKDNRTLVPIKLMVEQFGANVQWDDENRLVTIFYNDIIIKFSIGDNILYLIKDNTYSTIEMDTEAIIIENKTLAPLRFIVEALGGAVRYLDDTQKAFIEIPNSIDNEIINNATTT